MKNQFKILLAIGGIFLLILIINVAIGLAQEFSADIVMKSEGKTMMGKMFSQSDKVRHEFSEEGRKAISIMRVDKKVIWMVMPEEKMYMEMPFGPQEQVMASKVEGEVERKLVGTDTIDGHPSEKYLITYKSQGQTHKVYQWIAKDLKFPIKTEAVDGKWSMEFKNVRLGSQAANLFEIPQGYQKFDMPMGIKIPGMK